MGQCDRCQGPANVRCHSCQETLCSKCAEETHKGDEKQHHVVTDLIDFSSVSDGCAEHKQKTLVFCVTCRKLICIMCQVKGECADHESMLACDLASAERAAIELSKEALSRLHFTMKEEQEKCVTYLSDIKDSHESALKNVNAFFLKLESQLAAAKTQVVRNLEARVFEYTEDLKKKQHDAAQISNEAEVGSKLCESVLALPDAGLLQHSMVARSRATHLLDNDDFEPPAPPGIGLALNQAIRLTESRLVETVRVGVAPPAIPQNVRISPALSWFTVTWDDPSPDTADATEPLSYEVEMSGGDDLEWRVVYTGSSCFCRVSETVMDDTSSFRVRVRSGNRTGWGNWSQQVVRLKAHGMQLDASRKGSSLVISNMSLTATSTRKAIVCVSSSCPPSGVQYVEFRIDNTANAASGFVRLGLATADTLMNKHLGSSRNATTSLGWNGSQVMGLVQADFRHSNFEPGHRVGMLVDVEHSFAHFYINSVKVGSASGFPRNEYTVAISIDCVGDCVTLLPDARPPNALE